MVLQAMIKQFHPLFQQELGDLGGVMGDGLHRLDAVGHPGGVAEVMDGFERQPLHEGAHHGQGRRRRNRKRRWGRGD
jgi:hypothetical protein